MDLLTKLKILMFFEFVGKDEFGNSYYEKKKQNKKTKRSVIYNGNSESSKIPSGWHSWLHYTVFDSPKNENLKKYSWQKPHLPNLSGTIYSYKPDDNVNNTNKLKEKYDSWDPNKSLKEKNNV